MLQIAPRYVGQVVYGFGWGGGAVGKAVAGEEAGQVVGDRRIQGGEPLGRLGDFLVAVVQAGDDERRYFQVTARVWQPALLWCASQFANVARPTRS